MRMGGRRRRAGSSQPPQWLPRTSNILDVSRPPWPMTSSCSFCGRSGSRQLVTVTSHVVEEGLPRGLFPVFTCTSMYVTESARRLPCATSPGPVYQPHPRRPATAALRMPRIGDWADKRPPSRKMTRFGYLLHSGWAHVDRPSRKPATSMIPCMNCCSSEPTLDPSRRRRYPPCPTLVPVATVCFMGHSSRPSR